MHICYFTSSSANGNYFQYLVNGLIATGARVSLITLSSVDPPKWLDKNSSVTFLNLCNGNRIAYPLAILRLARYLRNEKVTVLHSNLFDAGLIAGVCRSFCRSVVFAYTRHHSDLVHLLGTRFHVALDRWMARRSHHLIAVSEAVKTFMVERDQIESNIDVVYLGFDFDKFTKNPDLRNEIRNEYLLGEEEILIGYVGNFVQAKGHEELILAFAGILDKHPDIKLMLVGDGDVEAAKQLAIELNLIDRVIFAGWQDNVPAFLNAMDIFVQPSLSEAFSQVLIEAMATGLPVIATVVGGAVEVIDDGKNGVLVNPGDSDELQLRLSEMITNEAMRNSMGKQAAEDVRSRFSIARAVDMHVGLYNAWVNERDT